MLSIRRRARGVLGLGAADGRDGDAITDPRCDEIKDQMRTAARTRIVRFYTEAAAMLDGES